MSDSVRPHGRQPTRLLCPWDSPGKNTGVGCHFLLQCMKVKSESEVAQSCPTLSDPMDCSLPGSSVHGIFHRWQPTRLPRPWGSQGKNTGVCSPRDSQESSPTPQFKSINSSVLCFLYGPTLTSMHDYWKNHSFKWVPILALTFTSNMIRDKFLQLSAAAAKLLQSCPTLCDPIDGSPPGSPIPGILQARTPEWVAISFSNA